MPLFNLFWTMLWFFLFIVWIWLVISVFADIFRSKDLSGGAKAVWVLFVVILPYLGVLVYLIARGQSMHERSAEQVRAIDQAQRAYIRDAAAPGGTADELAKLADLRDRGVIDDQEFQAQKAKLLA